MEGTCYGTFRVDNKWTKSKKEKHMKKDELIKYFSEVLPDNADITFSTVTWSDDNGVHSWDTDDKTIL